MTEGLGKATGMSGGSIVAFGAGIYLGYKSPGIAKIEDWAGNTGWGEAGIGAGYFGAALALFYLKKYIGVGGTGIGDLIFSFLIGFLVGLGAGVFGGE